MYLSATNVFKKKSTYSKQHHSGKLFKGGTPQ